MAQMEDLQMTLTTRVMVRHSRNHSRSHSSSNSSSELHKALQMLDVLRPVMPDKTDGLNSKSMCIYSFFVSFFNLF